jgi:hypothetical protein
LPPATPCSGRSSWLRAASWCARWSRRPRLRHLFTIDVEGAAFYDYDPQEDVHDVKKWTPALGSEASTRSITT